MFYIWLFLYLVKEIVYKTPTILKFHLCKKIHNIREHRLTFPSLTDPKIACKYESVSSEGFKLARVTIPGAVQVLNMTLVNQYSNSPCTPGVSFGHNGPDIFASNGCRGNFLACYEIGKLLAECVFK